MRTSAFAPLELGWRVGADEVALPHTRGWGEFLNGPEISTRILDQARRRLSWALANPERYNRHLERHLPLAARVGWLQRHFPWPTGMEPWLPDAELRAFAAALERGGHHPARPDLTVDRFLADAAVAYDAAFPELEPLAPLDKYRRRADTRHGGLLDLAPDDATAFRE